MIALMDIDGVLAPYGLRKQAAPQGCVRIDGKPVPRKMARLLCRLEAEIPVMFVSTWDERAEQLNMAFGLHIPHLHVGCPPDRLKDSADYKARAVKAAIPAGRAVVWFEDDARLPGLFEDRPRVRFVAVPAWGGLTPALVQEGIGFLRRVAA